MLFRNTQPLHAPLLQFGIDLRVLGIASSKRMLMRETGIDLDNWRQEYDEKVRQAVVWTALQWNSSEKDSSTGQLGLAWWQDCDTNSLASSC